jgi:hypothetical protein
MPFSSLQEDFPIARMRMRGLRSQPAQLLEEEAQQLPILNEPLTCGCTLTEPRTWCAGHADLLAEVLSRWAISLSWQRRAIWQESDALGLRGHLPADGKFESSILNKATPESVERMFRVAHGLGPLG